MAARDTVLHSPRMRVSDESYIIDLCDRVLNLKAKRQHRFDFLRGDPGKNRRCAKLPVDAYYEELKLVVEYRERQHTESVPLFDKRLTCSGCAREEQRRRYDQRRQVQPALALVAKSRIGSALGVSEPYSSAIQAGKRVPHPRHWRALARMGGVLPPGCEAGQPARSN